MSLTPREILLELAKRAYQNGLVTDKELRELVGIKSHENLNSSKGRSYYRILEKLKLKPFNRKEKAFLDGWD